MAKRKRKVNTDPLWRFVFIVYIAIMLWLLFGRSQSWTAGLSYREILRHNISLTPFYTIDNYLNVIKNYPESPYYTQCIIELVGNTLLFIPAGWLLPRLFGTMRKFFPFLLTCLLSIFFVESLQLFTLLGHFDVDDIILNISGILIGYILYALTAKK